MMKPETSKSAGSDLLSDIAIVGIAGRFPGARDIEAFWQNLREGVESVTFFSDQELEAAGVDPALIAAPNYVKANPVLEDADLFDAAYFKITPREAELMDPQHRLFLECAVEALENAGYNPRTYEGRISVYGGAGINTYLLHAIAANPGLVTEAGILQAVVMNDKDYLSTRVSYKLGLTGPSMTVQTACSTALVGVHLSCESLLNRECDMAMAGGVTVSVPIKTGYVHVEDAHLSPDGHCRAFDAEARGTIFGSGVGIVVLKRLADALEDGDTIYAVIKGTAINNDGDLKVGYSAPSVDGQAAVIAEAIDMAGVDPETIAYVEAHGTGTELGDSVEIAALTEAFRLYTQRKGFCGIGSVKTNVGHLVAAAGAAGLIKTVLALKHKMIPPSLNFERPNPKMDLENSPFYVNTQLRPWQANEHPRRAGVSSFGMGGTNVHVVLEEAPAVDSSKPSREWQLVLLSAKTEAALEATTANLKKYLCDTPDVNMADVAYTLQVGRQAFEHRRALVCHGYDDAIDALEVTQTVGARHPSVSGPLVHERAVAFMFPGVGDHYVNMGWELYGLEPIFRQEVDRCCDLLLPVLGLDLRQALYPGDAASAPSGQGLDLRQMLAQSRAPRSMSKGPLAKTEIAQPAVFVTEYALAQLLQAWGIEPQALIGYSVGEYTAACVAGVLSLEDALTLVARRAQMIQRVPAGGMLAVSLSEEQLAPWLSDEVDLAVVNGSDMCVLAGPAAALEKLEQQLAQHDILSRRLETSHAFHSKMMEPLIPEFTALVQGVHLHPPQIPYLSNVSGDWITDAEATDAGYWARHLCQTVQFASGLADLLSDPERILIEVGPGQSLGSFAKQHPSCTREQAMRTLPTLRYAYDKQSDQAFLLTTLGRLWLTGLAVDWRGFYGEERRRRIPLPTYPFEGRRYWLQQQESGLAAATQRRDEEIAKTAMADWFYEPAWKATDLPKVSHKVDGLWLVFEGLLKLGEAVEQHLVEQGARVIRVRPGERFARVEDGLFTVRPDEPADYAALLDGLEAAADLPEQIVHMWNVGQSREPDTSREVFSAAQRLGFYSLLYLVQAIGARGSAPMRLTIVTSAAQPVGEGLVEPEKATLLGLCRVIPQEMQNIRCRAVDVVLPDGLDDGWQDVATLLAAELMVPTDDVTVAYRGGKRYVQHFVSHHLAPSEELEPLREGGVYLITGGLGSIGLALAKHLAQRVNAKLVLTGRSGLPDREEWDDWLAEHGKEDKGDPISHRIRQVRVLESLGAEVDVVAADVANREHMQAAVARTIERFGELHGVIHAAGSVDPDVLLPIRQIDQALVETHFAPKAYGLYVLDEVLQDKAVDFLLLFSSLSTVLGGLGLAAYAAANSFMDAYTHRHDRTGTPNWICVNWDAWQIDRHQAGSPLGASVAELGMTPQEGIQAFALALASGATQLVHSTGDLDARIRQWVMLEALTANADRGQTSYARPVLDTAYVPASTQYEECIAAIWQEVLGIDKVGINDNFFDLGGNSLIGLRVISRIQEELGCSLSPVILFEAPTVNALARYVQPDMPLEVDGKAKRTAALATRRGKARENVGDQDFAVISMSGRFPGAKSVDQLWDNLCSGIESVTSFTDEELLEAGLAPEVIEDPNYVKARPILEDIDLFDAAFFGYSPREAQIMDPQHRLFLECAWESLELAGYDPATYEGLIGVFAGASMSSYLLSWVFDPQVLQRVDAFQAVLSNDKDSLTTTVSYKMNLKGPSYAVQTFCSTSLVAAHLACQSLANGECDVALVGGATVVVPHKQGYVYRPGGIMSPDGHCRAFDAQAQGAMFGDGVGVVALKRLEDALADGDVIHAVIKGSAVNNDGALKAGYTAPSVVGQTDVVRMALANSGVDPQTIGYVEAHGTATELGDPVEIRALTRAFRDRTNQKGYCAIGSVKTNVGHLDRAAGVVGLIKAALAVKHGLIPPSLYFESPNPEINFEDSPFFVAAELSQWPHQNGAPRRAGVNSLGVGGTNAHMIVEQPPERLPSGPSRPWQLLLLSARTASALDVMTANLAAYLQQNPRANLADVAYTLQAGRRTFEHRRILVCQSVEDATRALGTGDSPRVLSRAQPDVNRNVVFMFPGVGDHYMQMARELYEQEPVFADTIDRCSDILQGYLNADLKDLLYTAEQAAALHANEDGPDLRAMLGRSDRPPSSAEQKLHETCIAQPVVFVIEYALARLLMAWGVQPQAMVGYSLGEYVAACLSGVLSLQDALRLVAERAQMIQALPPGRMLAVSLPEDTVETFLTETVSLAAHTGEATWVLAGPVEAIDQLEARLAEQNIVYRPLETTQAFHSAMMIPLKERLTALARTVTLTPPRIPYLSNVSGTWITPIEATDPEYWAEHMCRPIRFCEMLGELLKEERVLLEVGPGQTLGSFAKQHPGCAAEQIPLVLPTMRYAYERRSDLALLLETLGKLWLLGVRPDWATFCAAEMRHRLSLPTYPFERQSYWLESSQRRFQQVGPEDQSAEDVCTPQEMVAELPREDIADWFYLPGWKEVAANTPCPAPEETKHWLLFINESVLAEQIISWLSRHEQSTIVVRSGDGFEQLGAEQFVVRPRQREDYVALLKRLQQQGIKLTKIVHMWEATSSGVASPECSKDNALVRTLNTGFYSLIGLVQAISELGLMPSELSIVTSRTVAVTKPEALCPEKATLIGPCRTIPMEYNDVTCRLIDIVLDAPDGRLAEAELTNLLGELMSDVTDSIVALRGSQRWVQTFDPVKLPPLEEKPALLRSNGVYLITGGLGGIGSAMAEHLARTVQARLVLMNRSNLPPRSQWKDILNADGNAGGVSRKIRVVQQLEALGAEVLVVAADVSEETQVREALEQALSRFGAIHGLIHAAGVPGEGVIQLKTLEMAAEVLAPKVMGTLVLERVLEEKEVTLDFLALFSSVGSFTTGGPGQVDYVAANAFLDAYAKRHTGEKRLTTSINWSEWQWNAWEAGLQGMGEEIRHYLVQNREQFGITFEEGNDALGRILSRRLSRVIVSTQDFRKLMAHSAQLTAMQVFEQMHQARAAQLRHPRPALSVVYTAPRDDLECKISDIWSDILGIDGIGIYDNFFELGGNSLLGIGLIDRLRKNTCVQDIPLHMLYQAPTVSEMARYLSQTEDETVPAMEEQERSAKRRERLKRLREARG